MTRDDMLRELDKIADGLHWAVKHHMLDNESNAALHCNPKVFYGPLTGRLVDAQDSVQLLRDNLNGVDEVIE